MCAQFFNGYTWAYVQIMQHTHMQKAEPIEAKKLLFRRMESDYS